MNRIIVDHGEVNVLGNNCNTSLSNYVVVSNMIAYEPYMIASTNAMLSSNKLIVVNKSVYD
jgi:hypothetical protein